MIKLIHKLMFNIDVPLEDQEKITAYLDLDGSGTLTEGPGWKMMYVGADEWATLQDLFKYAEVTNVPNK
ncbi:MAG: hypothetical protein NTZ48_05625 [Candidatus Omnitrophica bacterium]|nr:hypothetical protein [Candidatus Omnitrophota bacterium]